jgi:septum formation inhibitor-activating ATPase MinD
LITGASDSVSVGVDAIELAKAMAQGGADVMLVDWSPEGDGLTDGLGLENKAGLNELLQGRARFEDVVTRIPASGAHFIPAGVAVLDRDMLLNPEQLNLTFDALDTAYDHIIVAARYGVARALFEAILGRFDAGVVIGDGRRRGGVKEAPGTFLGFEVADIELFRLELSNSNQIARERLARLAAKTPLEARAS